MPKISNEVLQNYFAAGLYENAPALFGNNFQVVNSESAAALQSLNRHPIYIDTVLQYHPLRIHADGEFPTAMIMQRRPSESEEILAYRKQTYKAVTKLPISKVLTSLSKIRRSPDWAICFDDKEIPAKIAEEETLEKYLNNIPGIGSITDWAFGSLLKQNAIDANAIIAVLPLEIPKNNEYYKPVPIIFNCDHVLEYSVEKQITVLKSRKKINYLLDDGTFNYGSRFYYIDDIEIIIYDQGKDGFTPVFQLSHQLGTMPAFKVRGEAYKQYDNMVVNRSRLDAMIPYLDEAACEYSDLKGSKIQHLYPLFWYFQNKSCNACNGVGKIPGEKQTVECSSCSGTGKVKFSPFAHIQVDPAEMGKQTNPVPPAGYVTRDTAILELQEKSVENNIFKSLSAINMQFLDQTPLNISGQAKNVDREELQNFIYNFAEDLIYSIDKSIFFMNEWRYSYIIPDAIARKELLPTIPVPQNFDLLPTTYLMDEVTKARNNKANPFLLATMEQEVAVKKFYNEPELATMIGLYFDLDPLPGYPVDEKMSLISNKAITQEDFVISSYMASFIKRAIREDKDFAAKEYDKQMEVLIKYAKEKITANDAAAQMIDKQKQAVLLEMQQQQGGTGNAIDPKNPKGKQQLPAA